MLPQAKEYMELPETEIGKDRAFGGRPFLPNLDFRILASGTARE